MKTWIPVLVGTVLLAIVASFAEAQQPAKVPRIGYLGLDDASSPLFNSFRQGLRELGYIEGQNIMLEPRFAYGSDWRLNTLAAELIKSNIDVIVAQTSSDLFAARSWTKTIPIVTAYSGSPRIPGIGKNMDGSVGNVTGIAGLAMGLGGKWLELLKESVPEATRVGVLYSRFSAEKSPIMKQLEDAARSLRVELQLGAVSVPQFAYGSYFGSTRSSSVGSAFAGATRGRVDAFIVLPDLAFDREQHYIADLALKTRIPGIFWRADFAEAGGLMSYGANPAEQFRRAAFFVDKILKGAKPAELPVEIPKTFELVINLKTAKEIGVIIPSRVLAWADKIIK